MDQLKEEMQEKTAHLVSLISKPIEEKIKIKRKAMYDPTNNIKIAFNKPINREETVSTERSKLHTREINTWLKSRYSKHSSNKYLYFPEEIQKRQQYMKVFDNFDSDGNGKLELDEFLEMFICIYIYQTDGTGENLNHFLVHKALTEEDIVDKAQLGKVRAFLRNRFANLYHLVTPKLYLTQEEFIHLKLSPQAQTYFSRTMRELTSMLETLNKRPLVTIPHSIEKMMVYLSYSTKRDELYQNYLRLKHVDIHKASRNLEEMLFWKSEDIDASLSRGERLQQYRQKYTEKPTTSNFFLNALGNFIGDLGNKKEEAQPSSNPLPQGLINVEKFLSPLKTREALKMQLSAPATEAKEVTSRLKQKIEKRVNIMVRTARSEAKKTAKKDIDLHESSHKHKSSNLSCKLLPGVNSSLQLSSSPCKASLSNLKISPLRGLSSGRLPASSSSFRILSQKPVKSLKSKVCVEPPKVSAFKI